MAFIRNSLHGTTEKTSESQSFRESAKFYEKADKNIGNISQRVRGLIPKLNDASDFFVSFTFPLLERRSCYPHLNNHCSILSALYKY